MLGLSLGMRFFIFLLCEGLGFFLMIKTLIARNLIGPLPWAEQHFSLGTYSFLKLIGVGFVLLGFVFLIKG